MYLCVFARIHTIGPCEQVSFLLELFISNSKSLPVREMSSSVLRHTYTNTRHHHAITTWITVRSLSLPVRIQDVRVLHHSTENKSDHISAGHLFMISFILCHAHTKFNSLVCLRLTIHKNKNKFTSQISQSWQMF